MPDNSAYFAFLRDPDQEVRRAELRDFFGPHAETFLAVYDRLREDATGSGSRFRLLAGGFEVAAFFLGPVWFFYRKMWLMASIIIGLIIVFSFIPRVGPIGLILGFVLAVTGRRVYVQHAVQKLSQMHATQGQVTSADVQAAGGVSWTAGLISGGIILGLTLIGLVLQWYAIRHGMVPAGVRPH